MTYSEHELEFTFAKNCVGCVDAVQTSQIVLMMGRCFDCAMYRHIGIVSYRMDTNTSIDIESVKWTDLYLVRRVVELWVVVVGVEDCDVDQDWTSLGRISNTTTTKHHYHHHHRNHHHYHVRGVDKNRASLGRISAVHRQHRHQVPVFQFTI